MRRKRIYVGLLILVLFPVGIMAQEEMVRHNWDFKGEPLGAVLKTLEEHYQIRFAYSRAYLPMNDPITLNVNEADLDEVLSGILTVRGVMYRISGSQVLLRKRSKKVEELSQKGMPSEVPQQTPLYSDPRREELLAEKRKLWRQQIPLLNRRSYNQALLAQRQVQESLNAREYTMPALERLGDPLLDSSGVLMLQREAPYLKSEPAATPPPARVDARPPNPQPASRLAQISLLPYLGTNLLKSDRMSNNLSVNILWGTSGGVGGLEIGGIANTVAGDVRGIQIAGLVNVVSQDVVGMQFAGLSNLVGGTAQGVQFAGLYNRTGEADAIQLAGAFNVARDDFSGVQIAPLFNVVKGEANALQIGSLFNAAKGSVKTQIGGLVNVGGDVAVAQMASLINIGGHVKGVQVGLINVADSVSGLPIGLFTLVNKGYNRLELSTNETFFGNLAVKIGVKQFYNIFMVGGRYDDEPTADNSTQRVLSWCLGYGLGTSITLGPRYLLNLEAISLHVNEREDWTNDLHQLHQFKILFDGRIGRKISVFAGPVANLMVSKMEDPETGEPGTKLAPYTLYEKTTGGTSYQGWVGLSAGIRF